MGQEESREPAPRQFGVSPRRAKSEPLEHEGLLKLRKVPFSNSQEIEVGLQPLFLEKAQLSLGELLDSRLFTAKLFPAEDIERLIESVAYTVAYLSENGVIYRYERLSQPFGSLECVVR